MNPQDGLPAPQEPVAPTETVVDVPAEPIDYSSPNDLDFELSPEQEKEFVEQILKDGNYEPTNEPEPVTPPVVVEPPAEPATPVVVEEPKPEPVAPVDEVATLQTDDLWIEVEQVTLNDLDEEVVETVKLSYDPNDPSSFIPDNFNAKNTKQLAEIMDAKAEMAKLYEERKSEFDKGEAQKAAGQKELDLLASWDQEIEDLIASGVLEKPKAKEGDKDYEQDPAVKKNNEIFAFLAEQNLKRSNDGIAPITSFSLAYTMFENDAKRVADAEAKKVADENTKKAGAMVGGGSAASGGSPEPKGYTPGRYNNIWSVPVEE